MSHTRYSDISANIFAFFFKLVRLLLRAALSVSVSVAQAARWCVGKREGVSLRAAVSDAGQCAPRQPSKQKHVKQRQ